ncbi:MAG: S9 family peptidase [Bacteroidales bacterium]|nr:S9 family peptidase [Bacteroidales bacterium]
MKSHSWSFMVIMIFMTLTVSAQSRLQAEDLWKMGRVDDIQVSPDGQWVLYGITKYDLNENKGNRDLYILPVAGGEAKKVTDLEGHEFNGLWRPDGKKIGFLSAISGTVQIWEVNPDGSDPKQISNIENGINGFSYSPVLTHILYCKDVKLDSASIDYYPDLPKADAMIFDDLMYRHWNNWHDYAYSHIFVTRYDTAAIKDGIDIMENEPWDTPLAPFGGMEQIAWSPDGKSIVYTCKKMKGKEYSLSTNSDLYLYDLKLRMTYNITKEMMGYDMDPVFSHDGKKMVWKSMATDGYESDKERMMMLDLANGSIKELSEGFDQNCSNFVWAEDNDVIYFISGANATYQVYGHSLSTGNTVPVTRGAHDYTSIAQAGTQLVGTRMSMSMPVELYRVDLDGSQVQLSFTNKVLLSKITMGEVRERWVTTTDGKDMLVWVIYPPNFDAKKKYPALLYCQGGPQSAVSQFWSYRWNLQMMAANDYIVVAPNRRGLPTFGQEWNDQIAGDYGGQNMKDMLSAIDALAKEPYVDENRLGAVGASYGGYSVLWLAGNHDKRFKAFISHCGIYNFESMYGSTEEYFFVNHDYEGPYWEKPKPNSYNFSPHLYVDKWDTPIMLVTGMFDFRIPYTQSLEAFNAAQLRGIPSRLVIFPEETHFVLKPQNAVLWQREFFRWLDTYLK